MSRHFPHIPLLTPLLHEAKQVIQKFLPLGVRVEFIWLGKDQGYSPAPLPLLPLEPQFGQNYGQEYWVKARMECEFKFSGTSPPPGTVTTLLGSSDILRVADIGREDAGRSFRGSARSSGQSLGCPEDGHSERQEERQPGAVLHTG